MAHVTHVYHENDEYENKHSEPSTNESHRIEKEETYDKQLFTEILTDDDADPSISDMEHSKSKSKTPTYKQYQHRKKSKSSTNVLLQSNNSHSTNKIRNKHRLPHKQDKDKQRRHSESSSESHSNEYHRRHTHTHQNNDRHKHKHNHRNNNRNNPRKMKNKVPILIPLNVNGKTTKKVLKINSPKSLTRSILSRYKAAKNKSNTDNLGISGPLNVQHVIHVEWDDQRKAYKGIPDVWHSKIPQSYTVPTQELPVNFRETRLNRLNRSISLQTQSILNHHKTEEKQRKDNPINKEKINRQISVDYVECDDSLAMPVPGPRVFISSLNRKNNKNVLPLNSSEINVPLSSSDFHGLCGNEVMSVSEYLERIGIADLNQRLSVLEIRREIFIKMGFSSRDPFLNIPRHLQQQILTYLDIKSYLRACITCSDLASFLDDPIIWKIQVLYKSKVQGTLHKTNFRLRHRVWKATYMSMIKIDKNPSYYDHVWNIVVAGDTALGQNRLVVSLGRHWRCKLTGLEPVISAVNGTYRFGVDFVIRRVIIRDIIIKLQVWDGGNVMADTSLLKSVNIFLILFDLTNKNSFDRIQNIARSMISLLPNNTIDNQIKTMMVGNTTDNPNKRVISYVEAKRFANERGLMYIEANTDNNIESINNAFVDLAEECITFENEKKALKSALNNQQNNSTNCLIQ